jgi:hypothetical protein
VAVRRVRCGGGFARAFFTICAGRLRTSALRHAAPLFGRRVTRLAPAGGGAASRLTQTSVLLALARRTAALSAGVPRAARDQSTTTWRADSIFAASARRILPAPAQSTA